MSLDIHILLGIANLLSLAYTIHVSRQFKKQCKLMEAERVSIQKNKKHLARLSKKS